MLYVCGRIETENIVTENLFVAKLSINNEGHEDKCLLTFGERGPTCLKLMIYRLICI
jgi:hypothetical protein